MDLWPVITLMGLRKDPSNGALLPGWLTAVRLHRLLPAHHIDACACCLPACPPHTTHVHMYTRTHMRPAPPA
jgi:hypothetical protein